MIGDPWMLEQAARQRIDGLMAEAAAQRLGREAGGAGEEPEPVAWREAFPGVDFRALVGGPELTMTQSRFRRGAVARLHQHDAAQAGYVLDGRLRVSLPDEQLVVAAGECYLLPPGVPHQIRALEPTVVLDLFSPGRAAAEPREALTDASSGPLPFATPAARPGPRRSRVTGGRRAGPRRGASYRAPTGEVA